MLAVTLWFLINKKVENATPLTSTVEYQMPAVPPQMVIEPPAFPEPALEPATAKPLPTKSPHAKSNN